MLGFNMLYSRVLSRKTFITKATRKPRLTPMNLYDMLPHLFEPLITFKAVLTLVRMGTVVRVVFGRGI